MKKYAIIVAGGTGTRMKSTVPKQFLLVDDVPIIVHTIRKFQSSNKEIEIIVVLPEAHIKRWEAIQFQFFPDQNIQTAIGGITRSASVLSGLTLIQEDGLVAIHDAVRPFVHPDIINASFKAADESGSGVAAVDLKDSIRELEGAKSIARDRSNYVLVQTPQTFRVSAIKAAYKKAGAGLFTDDASVYEAAGNHVSLVAGSYDNIKITTPEDLK
ncbi:2-C-methyl-D-erythritol 4-phosphate cytidylyltransferase [Ekhidna lutea]|uniref:2-C-methyl-D-erythritol 4-phosphate cytidylyltransferase n=1 Tax=Ekhidna lutea TaxID=447679 RepID=A0A239J0S8_EKHLU|nr:2-C-methyl-D-erythritol 4-phosphate cytidylyltransferase [Ekhidna lutea]SNS99242.1 2-C-methyl-D-erythritol 4-phosphate cytidylyltransferase [Ekhidna lutea]